MHQLRSVISYPLLHSSRGLSDTIRTMQNLISPSALRFVVLCKLYEQNSLYSPFAKQFVPSILNILLYYFVSIKSLLSTTLLFRRARHNSINYQIFFVSHCPSYNYFKLRKIYVTNLQGEHILGCDQGFRDCYLNCPQS